jgi:branched-chain amino acid transport system permease protein
MDNFIKPYPFWSLIILLLVAGFLWLVLAPWPPELAAVWGRKQVFLNALLGGITLGALYFLVAAGFTLIFGLMRIVNLAHGSLFMIGGYLGYEIATASDSWLLAFPIVFIVVALIGLLMQHFIFSKMEGEELRQTLVSIGLSIVFADLMLWWWGGQSYSILAPQFLQGPMELPLVSNFNAATGAITWLRYPSVRIWILIVLNRTALGTLIRAGVDDREMLAVSGVRIQLVFLVVFGFGAGLAGIAGIIGATFQSLSPGEDTRFLLASLVVVIVGGMGSIVGAALGALIIGVAEQMGFVYAPTYSVVFTFLIMAAVLAFRPQGLLGARR